MQDPREDLARPGAQHPDAYTNSGSVVQCGAWTSPLACGLPFLRLLLLQPIHEHDGGTQLWTYALASTVPLWWRMGDSAAWSYG